MAIEYLAGMNWQIAEEIAKSWVLHVQILVKEGTKVECEEIDVSLEIELILHYQRVSKDKAALITPLLMDCLQRRNYVDKHRAFDEDKSSNPTHQLELFWYDRLSHY